MASTNQLIISLNSMKCPACGKPKRRRQTFCGGCYHALPAPIRKSLYQRIGSGYQESFLAAVESLNATTLHLPEPMKPRRCRECGCTDDDCRQCIARTGQPCSWVEFDLCSACISKPTRKENA